MKKQILFVCDAASLSENQTQSFLSKYKSTAEVRICSFGEQPVKTKDDLKVAYSFNLQENAYSHAGWISAVNTAISLIFDEYVPDLVILNGYTLTSFSASIVSYFLGCQIGVFESGQIDKDIFLHFPYDKTLEILLNLADFHCCFSEEMISFLKSRNINGKNIALVNDFGCLEMRF